MAKSAALVCQYLENISRSALEKYQSTVRRYVRGRHGIYALYRGARLYYVGLTTDLRFRLRQHLGDKHGRSWDRFSIYLTLGATPLRELETLVVRIGKPIGNKQTGKFAHSDNLLPDFSKEMRSLFREEHDAIIGRRGHSQDFQPNRNRKPSSKGHPALASYTDRVTTLRARFKGKIVKARVRKDGTIRFGNKVYNSPSLAAAVACRRPTCNGWKFWSYERAPGDWIPLDQLRRR